MTAIVPTPGSLSVPPEAAKVFESMLPSIRRVAGFAFRRIRWPRRQELIADVVADAFVAFARLVEQGKADLAYPTVLAWFGVRRVRDGRQVGCRQNTNDLLSCYARHRRGFTVQALQKQGASGRWEDIVIQDKRSTPAEIAACRLDFRAWLLRLDRRQRAVALQLAAGNPPTDVARYAGLSRARISQLRRELRQDWEQFQAAPAAA